MVVQAVVAGWGDAEMGWEGKQQPAQGVALLMSSSSRHDLPAVQDRDTPRVKAPQ
jgi:hypothetical protein